MVRFENVGLRYGLGPEVLRDLSFRIDPHSFQFLTGPSGAGKTSLLRLLFLSMKPTRGLITQFGHDVATLSRDAVATLRRRIGIVFQDFRLLDHMAEGSAANRPVIEVAVQIDQGTAPNLYPAAATPIDADVTAVLRGLNDFSPKPWPVRFREMQAAGGRIDITKVRLHQGDILAIGGGALSLNSDGRLEGELRVTMAGLEQFLTAIGAQQRVQASPSVDRLAGALDRLAPGLGDVARQQAGANISLGINMLGEQTTLEGKRAVTLPLRFNDGAVYLGPIPIGNTPALF